MKGDVDQLPTMASAAVGRKEPPSVRILIGADSIGPLSSRRAGEVIASGWLPAAEVSVLPIGEAGGGFAAAYADLIGVATSSWVANGIVVTTGQGGTGLSCRSLNRLTILVFRTGSRPDRSAMPSRALLRMSGHHPGLSSSIWPDCWVHDAGAGLLAALGATADRPLDQRCRRASVDSAKSILRRLGRCWPTPSWSVSLPAAQVGQPLLGLRGITSLAGWEAKVEPETMLRTDAALEAFARLASPRTSRRPVQEPAAASGSRCLRWVAS